MMEVIEYTEDQKDAVHEVGHYEVLHRVHAERDGQPICGAKLTRKKREVKSKRIFRLRCLKCFPS